MYLCYCFLFVGFVLVENLVIVLVIVVEGGGYGGLVVVLIVCKLFDVWLFGKMFDGLELLDSECGIIVIGIIVVDGGDVNVC